MKTVTTLLVFSVSSLLALGLVILFSAGKHLSFFQTQLISAGIGLAVFGVAATIDYRHLRKIVWPAFAVTVVLLVAVLFTQETNGAQRWFKIGGFSFQASELAKFVVILTVAWYGERFQRHIPGFKHGILIPGLFLGLILGLVLVQPDVGTTALLATVALLMLILSGIRERYWVPAFIAVATVATILVMQNDVRSERIHAWLHPEETKKGKGMQAWEARVAFAAGDLTGRGLGNSRQKDFIFEHRTDFVFPIVGEELGLPGTLGVVGAFVILLGCGYVIASRAPDQFGLLLGAGITFMIGIQAFVNIGVVTTVLPNKGLPLPFVSYGGSNLILMLGCVGLLLGIARQAREGEDPVTHADEARSASPFAPQIS